MEIKKISNQFEVKVLKRRDLNEILEVCQTNPTFYEYHPPKPTKKTIKHDMKALPPNKKMKDKFYVGFFEFGVLICVMDLIIKYPNDDCAFIGFFMMRKSYQGYGIGSSIINKLAEYLASIGYENIKIGYVKGNEQSRCFWTKNNFIPTGDINKNENYEVVVMNRNIKGFKIYSVLDQYL